MRLATVIEDGAFVFIAEGSGVYARTYVAGDERLVAAREDFAHDYRAEGSLPDGPKWSLCADSGVIGVGGIEALGQGVWGAWAYLADMPRRRWLLAAELARAVLWWVRRAHGPVQIQAVAADHPGAGRILAHIGFSPTAEPRIFVMEVS